MTHNNPITLGQEAKTHWSSLLIPKETKKTKRHQVKNACIHCQKACKKCDNGRPCQRCIKYNLSETCRNSERKKRQKGIKRGPYNRHNKKQVDMTEQELIQKRMTEQEQTTNVPPNHAIKQVTLPASSCSSTIDVLQQNETDFNHLFHQPFYPVLSPSEHNHLLLLALKEHYLY